MSSDNLNSNKNYKTTSVSQGSVPISLDVGLLTSLDSTHLETESNLRGDLGTSSYYSPSTDPIKTEEYLLSRTRNSTQALINSIFSCPVHRHPDHGPLVTLPAPTTRLPREKPLPKPKPLTKWEKFAKTKGIQHVKKDKMVYDEESKTWIPRWGYKGANKKEDEEWIHEIPVNAGQYLQNQIVKRRMGGRSQGGDWVGEKRERESALWQRRFFHFPFFKSLFPLTDPLFSFSFPLNLSEDDYNPARASARAAKDKRLKNEGQRQRNLARAAALEAKEKASSSNSLSSRPATSIPGRNSRGSVVAPGALSAPPNPQKAKADERNKRKAEIEAEVHRNRASTASMGKFDKRLVGEEKKKGEKRKVSDSTRKKEIVFLILRSFLLLGSELTFPCPFCQSR